MNASNTTMAAPAALAPAPLPRLLVPPPDALRAVFTEQVISGWLGDSKRSNSVQVRLEVLAACGPRPSDPLTAVRVLELRAWKAAWETYLFSAFACGMFEGDRGKDLRARLTSPDDDDCRAAFAECMTGWWLAGFMKFKIDSLAAGRGLKNLDFRLMSTSGEIGVEVKAPFRQRVGDFWWGGDSDKIVQCMEQANKQFDKDAPNILVLVPALRTSICSNRRDLVKAAYGESVITFLVDTRTGKGGDPRLEFSPHGKFLNPKLPDGRLLKRDGLPAYRRIGAIVCIEETVVAKYPDPRPVLLAASVAKRDQGELMNLFVRARDAYLSSENEMWIDHRAVVLHNPYAYHPVAEDTWRAVPQLVPRDQGMIWTDGFKGFV